MYSLVETQDRMPTSAAPHSQLARHVVFYSGGAVAGAFGGGLQESAAYSDESCPDVYVVNSAGLPNALARVAAEYEIIKLAEKRGRAVPAKERAKIIHKHHAHLWDRIGHDFKHFLMPDTALGDAMNEQLLAGWKDHMMPAALRVAPAQAQVVALAGAAGNMWRQAFDPFNLTAPGFEAARTYRRDMHFWALYLRSVFPDIDKALAHPGTPRIMAQAYDLSTQKSVLYDSRPPHGTPDGLNRLIGTMCIIGQVPPVDGVEVDGGYTGFNGNNFEVMDRLIAEDVSFASARVTYVNLGPANLGTDEAMQRLNPHYLANRAAADKQQADVMRRHPFREFTLVRGDSFKISDKFNPRPRVIEGLRQQGREAYEKGAEFSVPIDAPLSPNQAARRVLSNQSQYARQVA